MTAQPPSSTSAESGNAEEQRCCLACGYILYGLGNEPRCPECGLLNIPDGYRRQVWELIDSRRRFFSGMFSPLRKRLPGWWWALDRDGDVRRSVRVAVQNILIAAFIIMAATAIAFACVVEVTTHYASYNKGDLTGLPISEVEMVWPVGIALSRGLDAALLGQPDLSELHGPERTVKKTVSRRLVFAPSLYGMLWGAGFLLWILLLWGGPAMVGLYTQIRKGLPNFARAPRTIIAAANYETHRLVYFSLFITLCLGVELGVRRTFSFSAPWIIRYAALLPGMLGVISAYAAAGWIGPLRSDYTKQLVRSRLHLTRIIVMYAIILPGALMIGVIELIGRVSES